MSFLMVQDLEHDHCHEFKDVFNPLTHWTRMLDVSFTFTGG